MNISNGMGSSESGLIGGSDRTGARDGGFMQVAPRPDLVVIGDAHRIPGGQGELLLGEGLRRAATEGGRVGLSGGARPRFRLLRRARARAPDPAD